MKQAKVEVKHIGASVSALTWEALVPNTLYYCPWEGIYARVNAWGYKKSQRALVFGYASFDDSRQYLSMESYCYHWKFDTEPTRDELLKMRTVLEDLLRAGGAHMTKRLKECKHE